MARKKMRLRKPLTKYDFGHLIESMREKEKHRALLSTIVDLLEKHAHAKDDDKIEETAEELLDEIVEELVEGLEDCEEEEDDEEQGEEDVKDCAPDIQPSPPTTRRRLKLPPSQAAKPCKCGGSNCNCGSNSGNSMNKSCNCGRKDCMCGKQPQNGPTCGCGRGGWQSGQGRGLHHGHSYGHTSCCGQQHGHGAGHGMGHMGHSQGHGHPSQPFLFRPNHIVSSHHCSIPTHIPRFNCDHRIQLRLGGLTGKLNFQFFRAKGCRVKISFECLPVEAGGVSEHVEGKICGVGTDFVDLLQDDKTVVTILQERIVKIEWLDKKCNPCRQHHHPNCRHCHDDDDDYDVED